MSKLSVRKFGVGVASLALVAGVSPAFGAAGDLVSPGTPTVTGDFTRLAGKDRVATSLAVARDNAANNDSIVVYLVGANALADAASAGALNKPVLVVPNTPEAQEDLGKEIKKTYTKAARLVAIGGKSVVSDEAIANIRKGADHIVSTSRLDGANRYETSVAVAKEAYANSAVSRVYLTRGDIVVDALAAGAITDGPVVLVNPSGTVDKSVVDYAKALDKSADKYVVLGGTGALSDAQVQQVLGENTKIDPWKSVVSEATLKANVQKAAALYFGQSAWQQQTAVLDTTNFFGLAGSAINTGTTFSTDPSKIDITNSIAAREAAFIGYNPIFASFKNFYDTNVNKLDDAKFALNQAVEAAKTANNVTRAQLAGIASNATTANAQTRVAQAFRNLYGGGDIADVSVYFTFKDATSGAVATGTTVTDIFTGLNDRKIQELVETDMAKALEIAAAKDSATTFTVADRDGTTAEDVNAITLNYQAIWDLFKPGYDKAKANADAAKKNLDDAVKAYKDRDKITVATGGAGVLRIAGADRFETAALLSIWATTTLNITKTEVYVASGNDANLVDAMVAGQLVKGPILLAPSTGTLPKSTESELARLGAMTAKPAVKVIGGTAAVSDDVAKAAAKVVKEAK